MHFCDQPGHPDQNDGAFDVVGQDVEARLVGGVFQGARLDVASSYLVLDGAKGMLDGSPAHPHGAGHTVEPGLNGLDHPFMLPPPAPSP